MTIREYIEQSNTPEYINEIPFMLYDIDYSNDLDLDIDTKTEYQDGIKYSFQERLVLAREEIVSLTKNMNLPEAIEYFKKETEPGNTHYWGGMFFIHTNNISPDSEALYLGIRMD